MCLGLSMQIITNVDNDNTKDILDIVCLMLQHGVTFNFYHELCARSRDHDYYYM